MKSPEEKIANELTKMNRALADISNKLTKIANATAFADYSMWTRTPNHRDALVVGPRIPLEVHVDEDHKPTDDSRNEQSL